MYRGTTQFFLLELNQKVPVCTFIFTDIKQGGYLSIFSPIRILLLAWNACVSPGMKEYARVVFAK